MSYVTAATGANVIVQPRPDASGCALYDVFLDEVNGYLRHNRRSEIKLLKILSLVIFLFW
jgi:hypothetical protein